MTTSSFLLPKERNLYVSNVYIPWVLEKMVFGHIFHLNHMVLLEIKQRHDLPYFPPYKTHQSIGHTYNLARNIYKKTKNPIG